MPQKQVDGTGHELAHRWCSVLRNHEVEEPNREHGADDPKGAKTVTAPATVSGEVLCELCHWETGKAHIKPATREVRRPAVQEPG